MKKMMTVAIGLVMVTIFFGCGSGSDSSANNDEATGTAAKAECISLPGAKPICNSDEKKQ